MLLFLTIDLTVSTYSNRLLALKCLIPAISRTIYSHISNPSLPEQSELVRPLYFKMDMLADHSVEEQIEILQVSIRID